MSKYRDRLQIIADILDIVSRRARKTQIMYQANLSYRLVEKYLKSLLERGLIECNDDSYYMITRKGEEFLQRYPAYLERCRRISEDIYGARKDKLLLENMCFNNECNSSRMASRKEVLV